VRGWGIGALSSGDRSAATVRIFARAAKPMSRAVLEPWAAA
jgi:hypothetical protein